MDYRKPFRIFVVFNSFSFFSFFNSFSIHIYLFFLPVRFMAINDIFIMICDKCTDSMIPTIFSCLVCLYL